MNKLISKIFIKNEIKTPKFFTIKNLNIKKNFKNSLKLKINYPIVLKPINEGSSLGKNL